MVTRARAWVLAAGVLLAGMAVPAAAQVPAAGAGAVVAPAESLPPLYTLRPGDELKVVVPHHPELTEELPVRPDGRLAFPIAGEVVAVGRTPEDVARELKSRLEVTLRNADVTVIVRKFADLRIYVGGEVNQVGVYPLHGDVSVLQAVLLAGGAKRSGSMKHVFVVRNVAGTPDIFRVDLRQGTIGARGGDGEMTLQPLDVVFVPKSGIARVNDFVEQYITRVVPATLVLGLNYNFGSLVNTIR